MDMTYPFLVRPARSGEEARQANGCGKLISKK
jgi:hypothetical protein